MVSPSLIQSSATIGNSISFVLGVAPTNGNILIALTTNYTVAVTPNTGWTKRYEGGTGIPDDVTRIWTKICGPGESATQAPFTDSNPRGGNGVIFEVSGAKLAGAQYFGTDEHSAAFQTVTSPVSSLDSVFLSAIATTGSNSLPTTSGSSPSIISTTGTSSSASPRAITGFLEILTTGGPGTATGTYPGVRNVYGLGVVLAPSDSSGDNVSIVRSYEIDGPSAQLFVPAVRHYVIEGPPGFFRRRHMSVL